MCVLAAVDGSGQSDSDTPEPPDDKPLTKKQADYLASLSTPHQRDYIYMVRGSRLNRSIWVYHGKAYNKRKTENLSAEWLNENGMNRRWRRKTFQLHPNFWFRVPTMARTKQYARIGFPKMSNRDCAACTADALIRFFDHAGLTIQRDAFISIRPGNPSFGQCCVKMRSLKKFGHRKPKNIFDPVTHKLEHNVLYLFQIRAVHINTGALDNTHTLCVFNKTIYDANIDRPMKLTRANLNICCVGGPSWVYDRTVRIALFVPKKKVTRLIGKSSTHLQQNGPSNGSVCSQEKCKVE